MAGTEQVDWTMPASEWSATLSHLEENDRNRAPYVRIFVERAMEELIDEDPLLDTEDRLQDLEEMCPHSLPRFSRTEYSIPMGNDVDKVTVRTWIDADLKNRFKRVVDEDTDYGDRYGSKRYGAALATALHLCRNGGRRQRINDRIERLIDAHETAEATEETEAYDPEELGLHYNEVDLDRLDGRSRQKKVYEIAQRLDPEPGAMLHRERDLRPAIEAAGAKTVADEYIEPVVDVLGYKPHPSQPILYVPESWEPETAEAAEATTDTEPPAVDRKPFDDMTKAERIEGIRVALARKADDHGGRFAADYNFIRGQVFDRVVSKGYASNVMADVADGVDGLKLDTSHGTKRITVLKNRLPDSLLATAALKDPSEDGDEAASGTDTPDTNRDDTEQDAERTEEINEEASAEMDALMNAQLARADGGRDTGGDE